MCLNWFRDVLVARNSRIEEVALGGDFVFNFGCQGFYLVFCLKNVLILGGID